VIFEAGMAMAMNPRRTVLVALGPDVQFLSDTAGKYIHRADTDSAKFRERLLERLRRAGCPVRRDRDGKYLKAGNFQEVIDTIAQRI
jgi:hypothetical protein